MLAAILPVTQFATLGPRGVNKDFITYFGYGSLVNRATRPGGEVALPARLYGWQRVWGHRVLSAQQPADESPRSCCSLTVQKLTELGSEKGENVPFIDGVVVNIPISELATLDQREAGYDRHALACTDFDLPGSCKAADIQVYVSNKAHRGSATEQFPILQSYIDCVLAGYCAVFEPSGMQQFVDSTRGWNGAIENDRSNPKYPRSVSLPHDQLALFDAIVATARQSNQKENR